MKCRDENPDTPQKLQPGCRIFSAENNTLTGSNMECGSAIRTQFVLELGTFSQEGAEEAENQMEAIFPSWKRVNA